MIGNCADLKLHLSGWNLNNIYLTKMLNNLNCSVVYAGHLDY